MTDKPDSTMDEAVRQAAVGAIKAKAKALFEERTAIRDQMAALDNRLRRNEIAIFDCRGAARLFNADIELPEDLATARAVWVRRVMTETPSRPQSPAPPAPPEPVGRPNYRPLLPPVATGHEPVKTFLGGLLDAVEPSVREIALQQLKRAGEAGSKASAIRQVVESILKKKVHDKTVGMTLYRLSKDKLVRREGQTWFFVPSKEAETKNPGGSAPGSIEARSNERR